MVGGLPNSAARALAGALRLGTSMPKSPGALGGRSITALHTTFSRGGPVAPESLCQVGARKVSVVAYPQLSKAPASNALVQALSQKVSHIMMPLDLFKKYLQADTPAASVVAEKALPAEIPAALEEPVSPITGLVSKVSKTLGDTSKGLQGQLEAIMQATGKSEVAVIAELRTDVEGLDALRLGTTVTSEDGLNKLGEKVIAFNEKYGFKPDLSTDAKKQQYIARLSNSIAGTDYKSSGVDWRFFVGRSSEDAGKKFLSTAMLVSLIALGALLQKSELAPEDAQAHIDEQLATTPIGRLLESPASKAGRKFEPQYKKTMALLNKYNEFDKKLKEEVAKGIKIEEECLTLSTGTGLKQIEKKVQDRLVLHAKWQPLIEDTILPENELAKSKEWASLQDPAQMKALEQEGATLSSLQKEIEAAQEEKNIDP
ncbi:MAG: hypothetical protein WCN87_04675, partial [Chlamydiota bacterium]